MTQFFLSHNKCPPLSFISCAQSPPFLTPRSRRRFHHTPCVRHPLTQTRHYNTHSIQASRLSTTTLSVNHHHPFTHHTQCVMALLRISENISRLVTGRTTQALYRASITCTPHLFGLRLPPTPDIQRIFCKNDEFHLNFGGTAVLSFFLLSAVIDTTYYQPVASCCYFLRMLASFSPAPRAFMSHVFWLPHQAAFALVPWLAARHSNIPYSLRQHCLFYTQ